MVQDTVVHGGGLFGFSYLDGRKDMEGGGDCSTCGVISGACVGDEEG